MPLLTRRKFLRVSATAAAAGALAVGADAAVWEPNHPKLVELDIPLERLPEAWDGFRIVQLSDIHYDDHFCVIPLRRAVDIVNKLKPDLLVLTGDFVTAPPFARRSRQKKNKAAAEIEPCAAILRRMRAANGTMAVLGNHDALAYSERVTGTLQSRGIDVLNNRALPLEKDGKRLWIAGVEDVLEGSPDLDSTLRVIPADEPVVLLAHEPDFADHAARYRVDLQLSGHSHGGQVLIPLVGAPWLPPLGRKYPAGLRRIGKMALYTNIGLGTIRVPVRWNCPPEITSITLRTMEGNGTNSTV